MNTRKIALSALGAALVLSTAATASFAAPGKGKDRMPIRPEAAFVHLLKVADTNKDGKITKEEFAARQDALFTEIDADKDGSITPKEMRDYRKAKMDAFRAANPRPERADAKAEDGKRAERRAERDHGWGKHGGKGGLGMIRAADTDGNGQVSKAEFTAAGEKMFDRLDKNKDGVISIDDMPDRPFL